jgi:nickel-type superoxide dismutase maturation protease
MHWPLTRVAVAEHSMEPALRPGDWLLVRRTRRVRAGQIVLARHPGRPDLLIVKRAARQVDGGWWLESDNPDAGAVDSRRFGPVPASLVEGRLLARYWRPRRPVTARSLPPHHFWPNEQCRPARHEIWCCPSRPYWCKNAGRSGLVTAAGSRA